MEWLGVPARLLHNMILSVRFAHKVCPINILCKAAELPPGRRVSVSVSSLLGED